MSQIHKHYELYCIIDSSLHDDQKDSVVEKFASFLKDKEGKLGHRISYGLKKLAYPINGKPTGHCEVLQFSAAPSIIKNLEIELKRDERVVRFLTTLLDKHGVDYNKKKLEKVSE